MKLTNHFASVALAVVCLLRVSQADTLPNPIPPSGTVTATHATCVSNQDVTSPSFYVAGSCTLSSDTSDHATLWTGTSSAAILPDPSALGSSNDANGVNSHGIVVGSYKPSGSANPIACYWKSNGTSYQAFTLPGFPSGSGFTASGSANGVNDDGVIVGSAYDAGGVIHPAYWTPSGAGYGAATQIGTNTGQAYCINATTTIGLAYQFGTDVTAGYYVLGQPGPLQLPACAPGGTRGTSVNAVSNANSVMVGARPNGSHRDPFIYNVPAGSMMTDPIFGADIHAGPLPATLYGVNSCVAVGETSQGSQAWIFNGSNWSPSGEYQKLTAINDFGVVVGTDQTGRAAYETGAPH